jgi:copper transport protein
VLVVGAVALAISTVGSMLVQGVYASGRPLEAIWTAPDTLDTHSRTFDTVHSVRAFLLVALAAVLVAALSFGPRGSRRRTMALRAAAVVLTVVLVATWPPAGHSAATGYPLATLGLNLFHMLAMVVWLGGLVGLVLGSGEATQREAIGRALPRFSTVALVSVSVLVVSGGLLAWAEVGGVAALTSTEYGRVLLAKTGGVAVLVALGNVARLWVDRHRLAIPRQEASHTVSDTSPLGGLSAQEGFVVLPEAVGSRRLRLGLVSETAVASVVLALTAALVAIVPARSDYVEPWSSVIPAGSATLSVQVPKPRVGDTVAVVTLAAPSGRQSITSVSGSVSRPGLTTTPAPLPVARGEDASDGATEVGLTFPDSGPWVVRLVVTPTQGAPTTVSFTVPVVADQT